MSKWIKYGTWLFLGLFFSGMGLQVLKNEAVTAWENPSWGAAKGLLVLVALIGVLLLWLRHIVRTAEQRSLAVRVVARMLRPIRWADR